MVENIWRELEPHDDGPERRYRDEEKMDAFSATLTADAMRLKDTTGNAMDQFRKNFKAHCVKFGCAMVPEFDPGFSMAESWLFERNFAWAVHSRRFFSH
ncbi:hypothetical protein OCU04_005936 [Sclerotinia nivalis]|uniref:Uncharacterized protein n=1 Tax=Sclerotinia nivalis TaxID=352851 RepID=A0A9X0ALY0_9HELO|nr:hypothetical protein OCU04_005936 [Sclerotinia nivalis]